MPLSKTVSAPKINKVGSGPREKMHLKIVDATKVRMPVSRGNVKTIAADDDIEAHINAEIVDPNSTNEI